MKCFVKHHHYNKSDNLTCPIIYDNDDYHMTITIIADSALWLNAFFAR